MSLGDEVNMSSINCLFLDSGVYAVNAGAGGQADPCKNSQDLVHQDIIRLVSGDGCLA